ncbi:Hypothetical predicted protein [Mytilus galloprovincialis]|uniref:Retrotransposon gag domain-containing protein n=1 Tax=Mytilus galloprovincialis TaxID=29158 RepID=A0A8B6GWD6_MYTGA|nr:Hypothetical predicted protein [Mytilus galloprovincialis]
METPRNRIYTQAYMPSEVRQTHFYTDNGVYDSRSPYDSGIENSTVCGTPQPKHLGKYTGFQTNAGLFPQEEQFGLGTEVPGYDEENIEENKQNWGKFWLIWITLLSVCTGLVAAIAWKYFPCNEVVKKSQEYVMTGLLGIIAFVLVTTTPREQDVVASPGREQRGKRSKQSTILSKNNIRSMTSPNQECGYVDAPNSPYYAPNNSMSSYIGKMPVSQKSTLNSPVNTGHENQDKLEHKQIPERNGHNNNMNVASFDAFSGSDNARDFVSVEPNNRPGTEFTNVGAQSKEMGRFSARPSEYPVRRTFLGSNSDVWSEFLQYFENIRELNLWDDEKARRVLLSTLRGQAETYAYGLPLIIQRNYQRLAEKLNDRFGHAAMKERYIADAKLRRRQPGESLRDFGQAIEDLYRRAYPNNPDIVEENAMKSFLDRCGQNEEFHAKPANRLIFGIDGEDDGGEINDENDFEIPFSSGESYQPQNDYRSETYRGRGSKSKNNSRQNNRGRGNSNYSNPARSRGGRVLTGQMTPLIR